MKKKSVLSVSEALRFGVAMTREKLWFILAILLFSGVVSLIPDTVQSVWGKLWWTPFLQAGMIVANTVIDAGLIAIWLRLYDGKVTTFTHIFSQYSVVVKFFIATALYDFVLLFLPMVFFWYRVREAKVYGIEQVFSISDMGIFLLLTLPGLYVVVRYYFFRYSLIDTKSTIGESFVESARLTAAHQKSVAMLWLSIALINTPGLISIVLLMESGPESLIVATFEFLIACSLFLTAPISLLALSFAYRVLSRPETETETKDSVTEKEKSTLGVLEETPVGVIE